MSPRRISGWCNLTPGERGASLAIGAFDGVHLGHRAVIAAAADAAKSTGAPLGVVSFDPHPQAYFRPDAAPFHLATPAQTERALAALGVERLHVLDFDAAMAAMSPETFAREVLAEGLGVVHAAVGFDFTFGKGRAGTAGDLAALGEALGFGVTVVGRVDGPGADKLSSTAVRRAVAAGDMAAAAAVLGRPFAIEGVVTAGRRLGRDLGFPTANVELGGYVRPRFGIYATRTRLADGRLLPGVTYIGPGAAAGAVDPRLEVWLFDFDEDLYGQTIETDLVAFIRDDAVFDSLEAMQAQVAEDAARARDIVER